MAHKDGTRSQRIGRRSKLEWQTVVEVYSDVDLPADPARAPRGPSHELSRMRWLLALRAAFGAVQTRCKDESENRRMVRLAAAQHEVQQLDEAVGSRQRRNVDRLLVRARTIRIAGACVELRVSMKNASEANGQLLDADIDFVGLLVERKAADVRMVVQRPDVLDVLRAKGPHEASYVALHTLLSLSLTALRGVVRTVMAEFVVE